MSIIELTASNDKDMDNSTNTRQQEEELERNAQQLQNITHIESTTHHTYVIHTNTGYQTLQFPKELSKAQLY